ncbi:chitosanase [Kutzneria sp. CA-103260]|uniref:chitosanase n=1 Tax=Kutzneria sp. CA-103260 TaxID=2802641 RepID=UPI001BA82641|nr:chitosanase [Kutzneria sp. CA-103260]QUQ63839.1 chitosanase [Kutzneria sp. CA-103260]
MIVGIALAVGVAGCSAGPERPTPTSATTAEATATAGDGLTVDQRRRADQLVSIFENGTPVVQYDYAENLHDGRGITAGRAGFTTNDGDALRVIKAYTERVPDNGLARFVPELERLAGSGSDDTSGLPEGDYIAAWKQSASDPVFRRIQDSQVDQRYFVPAMAEADRLGLTTPLARAELYDAAIQHGTGSDQDGLPALISRAGDRVGNPSAAGEKAWLGAFFDVRAEDLRNPANGATKQEWAKSVDRVECLRRIAAASGYRLDGPLTVTAAGTSYTLN